MANTLEIIVHGTDKATKVFGQISTDIDKMGKKMQVVGGIMMGVGAGIVGGLFKMADSYTRVGDEIAKMSKRTGIAVKTLSELRYMANLSGTSLEAMETSIRMMQRGITDASKNVGQAKDALQMLGIEVKDIIGLRPEDQFWKLAYAVAEVEDPTIRASIAMDLFGRAGTDMLPMLAEGKSGIDKMKKAAQDANVVYDEESAKASEAFQDAMTNMKTSLTGLGATIVSSITPKLTEMLEKITAVISKIAEWAKKNDWLADTILKAGGIIAAIGALVLIAGSLSRAIISINAAWILFHSLSGIGILKLAAGLAVAGLAIAGMMELMNRAMETPAVPKMQAGGIVRQPTLAMLGERGPEAVIPLNEANMTPIQVKLFLDGEQIADVIQSRLDRWNRIQEPVGA